MMNIIKYNRPKKEGGSGNTFINNTTTTSSQQLKLDTHTIFGQPYNGTQDVGGDLSNVRNITTIGGDINVKSTSDDVDKVGGNINADGTVTAAKFVGDIDAKQAKIFNAIIQTLSGDQISYLVGFIKQLDGVKLNFNEGIIKDLLAGNISVETLTVTKAAHFFSLIIDELKSVGGQIILTPANAKVDKVIPLENAYKCLWKATDGDKNIYNQFEKDDQVVCQTFNLGHSNTNVSNTYYWRLCTEVGTETIDGTLYNYIILSDTDKDTASISIPNVADKIVQLGHKTDKSRQNAIILSAYNSKFLDAELVAPSIVQYAGINDYQLKTHRKNIISTTLNEFVGNFKVSSGETIDEYIKNNIKNNLPEIKNGKDAEFYRLKPLLENAIVNAEGTLGVILKYNIQHIKGQEITNINAGNYYVRFKTNANQTYTNLPTGTISPTYFNFNYQKDYHKARTQTVNLIVELVKDDVILDTRIVNVMLQPAATFEIKQKTDTELASITSRVADNETKTENGIKTLTNQYSQIEQKATGIESKVEETMTILDGNLIYDSYINEWSNLYGFAIRNVMPLVNGKTYTLTIRGKIDQQAKDDGKNLAVYIYGKDWKYLVREIHIDSTELTTKSITFTYNSKEPLDVFVSAYLHPSEGSREGKVYLDWVMLREGSEQKEYTDRMFGVTTTTSSLIKQTKDEILLKTDKAGLRLNDDGIELDADKTTIKGNLNITDTKNGITVYETIKDNVLVPRINLQPKEIADITDMGNDTYDYFNDTVNQQYNNSWSLNFGSKEIDCKKNDSIIIDNIYLEEQKSNASGVLNNPQNLTEKVVIKMQKVVNDVATDIKTQELAIIKQKRDSYGYLSNDEAKFSISENGKYRFLFSSIFKQSADNNYPIMKASITVRIQKAENVMTYIGTDGMYSHSGPNKCFYVNNKQTIIQHGFNGIKWDNSATSFGNTAMKVLASVEGGYGEYKPVWFPFYNYTPTFQPSKFMMTRIKNTPLQSNNYAYIINPLLDCGICYVKTPAIDNNSRIQETYILLPSSAFTGNDGQIHKLPIGYTVEVINGGIDNNNFSLLVSADVNDSYQAAFLNDNKIKDWEILLDSNCRQRQFIYMGSFYSKDCNGNQDIWIVK